MVAVAGAARLPFTPVGTCFGSVPPQAKFYFIFGSMVLASLFVVDSAKQDFYRWLTAGKRSRRSAVLRV